MIVDKNNREVLFQGVDGVAVTPSDITVLEPGMLYVGGVGDVTVLFVNGSEPITFTAVNAGSFLPIVVKMVYSTGTDATAIVIIR